MSSIAAAHVDSEVTPMAGVEQQIVTSTAVEPGQPGDDTVTGSLATADVMKDDRPLDDSKESVDASATRNQCQLQLHVVILLNTITNCDLSRWLHAIWQ